MWSGHMTSTLSPQLPATATEPEERPRLLQATGVALVTIAWLAPVAGAGMRQAPDAAGQQQHPSLPPCRHAPQLQQQAEARTRPGHFRAQGDRLSIFTFPFRDTFIFHLPREPLSVYPQRWCLQETTCRRADCLGFLHPANSLLTQNYTFQLSL